MAENFDLIFGQNASQQYAWSDSDYQNGWETIGSIPPTAAQFDALQRRADTKAQELNNNLAPLVEQNTANNRQPLTTYALKDIRYSPLLPTGWFLECTTAGTTDSAEITLPSPLVENAVITDDTCVWKVRKIGSGGGEAIGFIKAFAGNGAIPSGYLLCDGAAYSRTAFPDLFACIGTDYGAGDGSTTFNVPDANQAKRFLQGDTVAGQVKDAGVPNIVGQYAFHGVLGGAVSATGALKQSVNSGSFATGGGSGDSTGAYVNFHASDYNSIYGNSTTVQPPALTARYIIKAFDGQTADSALVDITQFENELGGKADRSLSNLTDAGKSFSFPSDTYVTIPLNGSGTSYTAPADGYVLLQGITNTGIYDMAISGIRNNRIMGNVGSGISIYTWGPVKKGKQCTFIWSNFNNVTAQFYYANGEVPTP